MYGLPDFFLMYNYLIREFEVVLKTQRWRKMSWVVVEGDQKVKNITCIHLSLWKMLNFSSICGKLSVPIINNYWMRLSMISWIIKTEVCVICQSRGLRQITQTRSFDNSWYHAKTELNNCFITHFSHNSSSETEVKRSAILFLRRTLQGA